MLRKIRVKLNALFKEKECRGLLKRNNSKGIFVNMP